MPKRALSFVVVIAALAAVTFATIQGAGATTVTVVRAAADVTVDEAHPLVNYGPSRVLRLDASPMTAGYLRFLVRGVYGRVTKAQLLLYSLSDSRLGYQTRTTALSSWSERKLTMTSAPTVSRNAVGSSGRTNAGEWSAVDLTGLVDGNGTYSLAVTTASRRYLLLGSRESTRAPRLRIAWVDSTPPSTPTQLIAVEDSGGAVALSWSPSTDNWRVDGYTVYRDGDEVATVEDGETEYMDRDLGADEVDEASYTVDAFDPVGNRSPESSPVVVAVAPVAQPGSPSPNASPAATSPSPSASPAATMPSPSVSPNATSPSPSASPKSSPSPSPSPSPTPTTPPSGGTGSSGTTAPSPGTPTSCDANVSAGGSIQAAIDSRSGSATICLASGTYVIRSPIYPKSGNTIYGTGKSILTGNDSTQHAMDSNASNVTIVGLVIEHFNSPLQRGAIQSGTGWTIRDNEFRNNAAAGLFFGSGNKVLHNSFHHNGQQGLASYKSTDSLVESNEIAYNNTRNIDMDWEAGGAKFAATTRLTLRNNYVHDNKGPGLWTDFDNYQTLYEGNRVVNNVHTGIFHEISYDAVIRNNIVTGNATSWSGGIWRAGILVASSTNVQVYGNTLSGNGNGIAGTEQNRGSGSRGPWVLRNLSVHDNTIAMSQGQTGIVMDNGDAQVFGGSNSFQGNDYSVASGCSCWTWNNRSLSWSGWRAAGQDSSGTVK